MSDTVPSSLSDIDCRFTRGYVEAAFFSTSDEAREDGGDALQDNHDVSDLAPATWAAVRRDCAAFLSANQALIEACEDHHKPGSADDDALAHAGRDFWYTREGHGAGFWDGDWPEAAGEHLSSAAKEFGTADWYLGDDGAIWQMGDEQPRADRVPTLVEPDAAVFPEEPPVPKP